jgi:C1A family cysteine protease
MNKHQFGWIPDLPDQRDFLFSAVYGKAPVLPPSVDLKATCSPVEDQKKLGSCTANALVGALEFLERKDGVPFENLSRLFIYYNERVIEHTTSSDSGAMLRDGIKSLAKQGVCTEKKWPYIQSHFKDKPTKTCYAEASGHLITSYQRVQTLDDMRSCLAAGYPFVLGFTVYESFESTEVARTGVVPMPAPKEVVIGGHAVVAVGYNDSDKRFIARNSWGTSWGQQGYFTIPYDYLTNSKLAGDMWTIRREQGV